MEEIWSEAGDVDIRTSREMVDEIVNMNTRSHCKTRIKSYRESFFSSKRSCNHGRTKRKERSASLLGNALSRIDSSFILYRFAFLAQGFMLVPEFHIFGVFDE